MIRCPTCGELSQDSHKSCGNCGTILPQTKVRCPECGTPNAVGNLLCDNCNARLIQSEGIIPSNLPAGSGSHDESSPVKGISLPTRAAPNDSDVPLAGEDQLPDWLSGLTEDSEESFGTAGEPEEDKADTSSGHPDWFSGLLDENVDFGAAGEPDETERE
ncbi:MAG: zinc ribbon domain-containing protein, partial [Anaerolineae bacterium]|nr:zinc ribbon domain-containing protein [Anaerolineae bacterium]